MADMSQVIFGPVNQAVSTAQGLGRLDSATIWALISMVLMAYIWYTTKQANKFQDIRTKEAIAQNNMADAVSRLTEKIAQLQLLIVSEQKYKGGTPSVQGNPPAAS